MKISKMLGIAIMAAATVYTGGFTCQADDDQKEAELLEQLRMPESKAFNQGAENWKKTCRMLTAYLEGGGNPRLMLSASDASISMGTVQAVLFDAIHGAHLGLARKIAIFILSNTEAIRRDTEGEVTTEWTFEEACLALWLCERYADYPELIRSCWPVGQLGAMKTTDENSKTLARFFTYYFADREKDPESQYIHIQLFLSSENDEVLKLLLQRKAVHVIGDLIARHRGKDSDIVAFELYSDLLRLPFSSERYQEGIYFDASKFFGALGDEKRERLALTKTTQHRWDIFFDELEDLDRKKGHQLVLVQDVICFAIRTGEYHRLRHYLSSLPTDTPVEKR